MRAKGQAMRRMAALFLAAVICPSLAACGAGSNADSLGTDALAGSRTNVPSANVGDASAPEDAQRAGTNVLIAYFSMPEDVDTVDAVASASIVVKEADTIVIGSPVYWHNMSGMVRNLIDRFYGPVPSGALKGRKFVFLFQGAAPEAWMLEKAEYTMSRFARMYGMEYVGMAANNSQAKALSGKI